MEASQIAFFNSPSDERPISGPAINPPSPSPVPKLTVSRPQQNSNRSKYLEALAASKLDSDIDETEETIAPSSSKATTSRKRNRKQGDSDSDSVPKKKSGPKRLVKKLKPATKSASQLFLKPIHKSPERTDTVSLATSPTTPTPIDSVPILHQASAGAQINPSTSNDGETKVSVSVSVSNGTGKVRGIADVLTFCNEIEKPTSTKTGLYDCHVCQSVCISLL